MYICIVIKNEDMELELKINDGGRGLYFKASNVGDCVTRALAIAMSKDYKKTYDMVKNIVGYSPRNGIEKKDTKKIMNSLGFDWIPTMKIGQGTKVHLAKDEIPMDKTIICQCSGHIVCVKNGIVNDSYDSRRGGNRAVYGYWIVK